MYCTKGKRLSDYAEINKKKFKNKNFLRSMTKDTRSNSNVG